MPKPSEISQILESARCSYAFSAYQLLARKRGKTGKWHGGVTSYWPKARKVTQMTYFDIGSVTKAVVSTSLTALAVDKGMLSVSDTVADWVPEWKTSKIAHLRVQNLLSHSAGLQGWLPVFESCNAKSLRGWVAQNGGQWLQGAVGKKAIYSDLGFLILGEILKEVWGCDLEAAFKAHVGKPLKMKSVQYGPMPASKTTVATEVREGKPLQGIVFDENSQGLGGKTPHAGLFATADSLALWCEAWLKAVCGKSKWLSQKTAQDFVTPHSEVAGSSWAWGWDTKSAQGSSAGSRFSKKSFGHLGYPGCSVWIDPEREGFAVFLSNRVHPSRFDERIRKIRPVLHDAVARSWDARG